MQGWKEEDDDDEREKKEIQIEKLEFCGEIPDSLEEANKKRFPGEFEWDQINRNWENEDD